MFLSAAIIMLPIAMVLLLINVTVGIISRSAPTLNLFSFGFPITLISVFILLYFSAGSFGTASQELIDSGLEYVQTMIRGLANG
jgi:flagellar biosynthetic protein FliR